MKLGFKAPTGDFVVVDGLIPVGEGQWDFDFIGQLGHSFWPLPIYANLDIGYRLRLKNDKISRDPGNEWLFNAEIGYTPMARVLLALKLDGIRGNPSTTIGLTIPSDVKRVTYLSPTVSLKAFNSLQLEGALRFSLKGRNFPAGNMLVIGLVYTGKLGRLP